MEGGGAGARVEGKGHDASEAPLVRAVRPNIIEHTVYPPGRNARACVCISFCESHPQAIFAFGVCSRQNLAIVSHGRRGHGGGDVLVFQRMRCDPSPFFYEIWWLLCRVSACRQVAKYTGRL